MLYSINYFDVCEVYVSLLIWNTKYNVILKEVAKFLYVNTSIKSEHSYLLILIFKVWNEKSRVLKNYDYHRLYKDIINNVWVYERNMCEIT